MTDDELRKLAEAALADDAKATPGPMHARGDSIWSTRTEVARCRDYNPNGPADAVFFAAARTR